MCAESMTFEDKIVDLITITNVININHLNVLNISRNILAPLL